ncbi:MAG: hypothetical protein Q4E53_07590 [Eubacteriales bacterium]|nr:hypothetical protein [Eubacteriales bacterium]
MIWFLIIIGCVLLVAILPYIASIGGVFAAIANVSFKIATIVFFTILIVAFTYFIFSKIFGMVMDFPIVRLGASAFTSFELWYIWGNILDGSPFLGDLFLNGPFIAAFVLIGTAILYFIFEP